MKAENDEIGKPDLVRKFSKWKTDNHPLIVGLAHALAHPLGRERLISNFVLIYLKELPGGFRIVLAEFASIDSALDDGARLVRDAIQRNKTECPEDVCCVVVFAIEGMNPPGYTEVRSYGLGKWGDLATTHAMSASVLSKYSVGDIIKMLNKED
jgi:hypothetical protein